MKLIIGLKKHKVFAVINQQISSFFLNIFIYLFSVIGDTNIPMTTSTVYHSIVGLVLVGSPQEDSGEHAKDRQKVHMSCKLFENFWGVYW